jgi:hypothetical protein
MKLLQRPRTVEVLTSRNLFSAFFKGTDLTNMIVPHANYRAESEVLDFFY